MTNKGCKNFASILHSQKDGVSVDEVREIMFGKSMSPEHLRSTTDALDMHIKRVH